MNNPMNRWWIRPLLLHSIRSSVRRDLAGVWVYGPVPTGGAILAPNHQSWWDGYLLKEVAAGRGQPCHVLMTREQLARFPFLRLVGAADASELRPLARAARGGAWVVVFPEGEISPQGQVNEVQPGAAWLARQAGVPVIPVAVRVVMRGAQWPEAFVRFGLPCPPPDLKTTLNALLAGLDADLRSTQPDFPPAGYLRWVTGRASLHDEVSLPSRLLIRLGGFKKES